MSIWLLAVFLPFTANAEAQATTESAQLQGHSGRVFVLAFSPDGKTLASGCSDQIIKLWEVATKKERCSLKGHSLAISHVSFSSDGKSLYSGAAAVDWLNCKYKRGELKVWNLAQGTQILGVERFSPLGLFADGESVVGALDDGVALWSDRGRKKSFVLKSETEMIRAVAFSPVGKTFATAGTAKTVNVWDADTGIKQFSLKSHSDWVLSLVLPSRLMEKLWLLPAVETKPRFYGRQPRARSELF